MGALFKLCNYQHKLSIAKMSYLVLFSSCGFIWLHIQIQVKLEVSILRGNNLSCSGKLSRERGVLDVPSVQCEVLSQLWGFLWKSEGQEPTGQKAAMGQVQERAGC